MVPPTDIGNELFSLLLGVNSHQVSVFQGHLMCVALAYIKAKGIGPYLMESDEAAGLSPSTQQYPLGMGTSRKEYLSFLIISPSKPMIRFIICLSGSL